MPTIDPAIVDLAALAEWMDGRGLGHGPVVARERIAGGTQNVLLRIERGDRAYVLRRGPEHKRANSDEAMRREARVLGALAGSDVPHPALIAAEERTEVLGAAFYLMEPVDGFNATLGLPSPYTEPAWQHAMGLSMADAIAALGRIDHERAGLADFGRADGWLERQVPRWRAQLDSYSEQAGYPGPEIPGVDRVARWLEQNRPSTVRMGIIHGDFHFANVMFRHHEPALAAVVDWELATIGDPLLDLGHVLAMWPRTDGPGVAMLHAPGLPSRAEMIARYAAGSDRDLGPIDWYQVLACYRLGIILEGTHARACAGKAPREIGDLLHATTVSLFEQALDLIEA